MGLPLLPGRTCVLNDALGSKAAEKYAAGHSGPPRPPPPVAPRPAAAPATRDDGDGCGGSDKSFDMFD